MNLNISLYTIFLDFLKISKNGCKCKSRNKKQPVDEEDNWFKEKWDDDEDDEDSYEEFDEDEYN
ncbi:MAG: hypothetical protein GOP50_03195 [Candidatus Heimdallarchaeota archaeon]|nr:hypothetical protein [Candidatus Heimdallarchaeota archaeon]